jgi:hypothetical protein
MRRCWLTWWTPVSPVSLLVLGRFPIVTRARVLGHLPAPDPGVGQTLGHLSHPGDGHRLDGLLSLAGLIRTATTPGLNVQGLCGFDKGQSGGHSQK